MEAVRRTGQQLTYEGVLEMFRETNREIRETRRLMKKRDAGYAKVTCSDPLPNKMFLVVRRKGTDERFRVSLHSCPKLEIVLGGFGKRQIQ